MHVSANYVVVEKIEVEKKEGEFETVSVEDDFVYKGKVIMLPEMPVYVSNHQLALGDTVLFAKYSPDSHEIKHEDKKVRFINVKDLLAAL